MFVNTQRNLVLGQNDNTRRFTSASMAVFSAFFPQESKDKDILTSHESQCMTTDETYIKPGRSQCILKWILGGCLSVSLAANVALSMYVKMGETTDASEGEIRVAASSKLVDVGRENVCLSCESLGIPSDSDFNDVYSHLTVYEQNGDSLCCMNSVHGLRELLWLFSTRFQGRSLSAEIKSHPLKHNNGVHLYVDSEALNQKPPVLSWTTEYGYGAAYQPYGTDGTNGRIRIKESGLYHVYSFVTYKTKHPSPKPPNIVHTISRYNPRLPALGSPVLLIAKKTLPEVSERFDTSFLYANIRLRKDDEIFVRVSNLTYVYRYAPSNFFGVHFVRETD